MAKARKGRERLASLLFSWMVAERHALAEAIPDPLGFINLSWAAMLWATRMGKAPGDTYVLRNDIICCGGISFSRRWMLDEDASSPLKNCAPNALET
jgi:hypothetical protein